MTDAQVTPQGGAVLDGSKDQLSAGSYSGPGRRICERLRALLPWSVSAGNMTFEISDQSVLAGRNDLMSEVIVPLAPYSRRPADRVDFIDHERLRKVMHRLLAN